MNPQQAATAPTSELRDWLAMEDGWNKPGTPIPLTKDWKLGTAATQSFVYGHWWKSVGETTMRVYDHPHPPTLDGAAKALPEGWSFEVASGTWLKDDGKTVDRVGFYAWAGRKPSDPSDTHTETIFVEYATDEVTARYRLAVLCCLAEKEASK